MWSGEEYGRGAGKLRGERDRGEREREREKKRERETHKMTHNEK